MSGFGPADDDESDIDREIHIDRMKRELDELSGGLMISGSFEEVSPRLEKTFLARVCEFEKAPWDTNFNRLIQIGIEMVPPIEFDDKGLHAKLQEMIRTLGTMRCFLEQTDHLSDREMYEWLWSDALREETPDVTQLGGAWHISPIGSGNEEDTTLFLKYYANEKERSQWQEEFSSDALPLHCPLPYNRDRNLPRPE